MFFIVYYERKRNWKLVSCVILQCSNPKAALCIYHGQWTLRLRIGCGHEVREGVVAVKAFLGIVDGVGPDPSYWSFPVDVRVLEWIISHRCHNGFSANWMLMSMGLYRSSCQVRHRCYVGVGKFCSTMLYSSCTGGGRRDTGVELLRVHQTGVWLTLTDSISNMKPGRLVEFRSWALRQDRVTSDPWHRALRQIKFLNRSVITIVSLKLGHKCKSSKLSTQHFC